MRLSEAFTIYLSAAAPFGVAHYLRQQSRSARYPLCLASAAVVALLWPLAAFRLLLNQHTFAHTKADESDGDGRTPPDEWKVEHAKRALINSLRAVEDLLEHTSGWQTETHRHEMFAARECVERYAGLRLVASTACADDAPSARELELSRVAGRTGEDLLLAGRCIHRRSISRLLAHRERARAELIHALAAVRELAYTLHLASPQHMSDGRRITKALLQTFARAIELLSLLDDWQATARVARLLDAECARLRSQATTAEHAHVAPHGATVGEGLCTTQVALKAFAVPRPPTTM